MSEQEELQALRQMVATLQAQVADQQQALAKKDAEIENLNIQLDRFLQALRHAQKKIYGPSSEKMSQQMSLFEGNEKQIAFAKELNKDLESVMVTKKERKRNSQRTGIRAEMLDQLDLKVVEYTLPEDASCSICGGKLKPIGRKVVRTNVEYEKPKLIITQTVQWVSKCTQCGRENSDNPNDHFEAAPVPKPLVPKSMVSASLMAEIMHQKFVLGVPFARQEKEWYRLGVNLHRSEISRLTIRVCEKWLEPIYQRIHEELLGCEVLHMDETRIQCNKEPGKAASSDSYMWVMCSGRSEERQAVYFQYARSRNRETAKSLLSGFHGYLMTDAYEAYNKLEGVTRSLCWAHVRRKFVDSIPLDSQKREIPGSAGAEARKRIGELFDVEARIQDLPYEDKQRIRQEESRPILESFWTWVGETLAAPSANEELTKALQYARNQKEGLERFLEDGRLELTNNWCESTIRLFATGRRAWLFSDTPEGAHANGIVYTLVLSAQRNQLDVYEYLKYLLSELPNIGDEYQSKPELLDRYMPWSKDLPQECRLREKKTSVESEEPVQQPVE